jgi:hypothetical protein
MTSFNLVAPSKPLTKNQIMTEDLDARVSELFLLGIFKCLIADKIRLRPMMAMNRSITVKISLYLLSALKSGENPLATSPSNSRPPQTILMVCYALIDANAIHILPAIA